MSKCRKVHLQLHHNVWAVLEHPSAWAGFAGVLASAGAELDKPYSTVCVLTSAICSLIAILIRTPLELDGLQKKDGKNDDDTVGATDAQ